MKCILMNKNTDVALVEYNEKINEIEEIYEMYNIKFAPLAIKNSNENVAKSEAKVLNKWFRGRGIPGWRKDIESLLSNLGINSPQELLNKAHGLSLSDQYWIKEQEQTNLNWQDINFFTNDFKYKAYLEASFSKSNSNEVVDLYSPNNTTDGMLQKAWVIENEKRVLIKGTYTPSRQEPLNEWLASQICKTLGYDFCDYKVDVIDNKIISKCENFVNEDEELISAEDVFYSKKQSNNCNDVEHYLKILEEQNISNARKEIESMILLDYLILNYDRHLKNFGVIRNVENLKWTRLAPIFDNGESMECDKLTSEMNFNERRGKFFTNTNKNLNEILKYVDLSKFDIYKLKDIPEKYHLKLIEFKEYTDMGIERIDKLTQGLKNRIDSLNF